MKTQSMEGKVEDEGLSRDGEYINDSDVPSSDVEYYQQKKIAKEILPNYLTKKWI